MPVYNEANSIERTLAELYDVVVSRTNNIDVFVAEDGSTDRTKEVLLTVRDKFDRLNVRTFAERKGYPRAAREALLAIESRYDYILFMDSDGQYEPNDFYALWEERFQADFILGRRRSRVEARYRRFLSSGLNLFSRTLFHVTVRDLTSGFRLMKRSLAQTVAEQVKYSKHNFWSEFTARSAAMKISTIEVDINFRARSGSSKVYSLTKMPKVIWDEFSALLMTWAEPHRAKLRM